VALLADDDRGEVFLSARAALTILICRNEGATDTHIYAPNGMITHGLVTLSAITAQPFLSS
jgi:uncharacterized protein YyaL (SSP411 family)